MSSSQRDENAPLLSHTQKSYNTDDQILVKSIDEEYLVSSQTSSSSSSDEATVDAHDEEYLVNNRLGEASLALITVCICLGGFLAAVDTSIIITVFNEIGTEFHSSNQAIWIMTSYMLSTSAIQPLYGKLSDIFGRKSTLVAIICFFLVGSWLCGVAGNMVQMGIARAIAGLGGGGIMTMASVVIHDLVPMRRRGQYQSYVNMSQTIGATVGAPLGGLINDYLGWRYCFYINLPFCFFILYVYIYKMENYNLEKGAKSFDGLAKKFEKIDFIGAAFLLSANITFVTGTSWGGNTREWSDPVIIGLLAFSATMFVSFFTFEFNFAKNPLISRTLVKNRNTIAVCLNNFFLCQSTMAFNFLIPQYFMGVLGYSPASAGLWTLPRAISVAIGCFVAGRYLGLKGVYKKFVVTCMTLHVLTTLGFITWSETTSVWWNLVCMNVEGFIFGAVFVATMVALVADIPHSEVASATSMIFLCRSTGWLSGSTITAAIMQSDFRIELYKRMPTGPETAEIIEFVRTSITKVRTLAPEVQTVVFSSLMAAIKTAMFFGVGASIACFLVTLCLRNCKLGARPQK